MNADQKRRVETATRNEDASRDTKQKRTKQTSLGRTGKDKNGMVNIAGQVLVRIIRLYSGRSQCYDDDNLIGGAKSLRDAIASMLNLKGDSEKDGIEFIYSQARSGETETIIEIYLK